MIDISKLTESDKGRAVIYTDAQGRKERGVISSWNANWVFVKYGMHACATDPRALEWEGK